MDKNSRILITGGAGFLGSNVVEELRKRGYTNLIIPRSKENDLRTAEACRKLVKNIDIVIHLAAKVGGIGYNMNNPGALFYDNAMMGINLIEAAREACIKKFVCIGTICAYPKFTPVPFKEDDLWNGYPEETNAPYGLAKKMLLVQLQAYRTQYGFNGVYLLPVNLYGPGDNFNPESSHVIPALIKKICDAKQNGEEKITVWGDGSPSREFLYVEDAARGIVDAMEKYDGNEPVNLGSGQEITIKELVKKICTIMNFTGKIEWDKSKPNGQPKRCLDVTRAYRLFGFKAQMPFEEGISKTVMWYEQQHNKTL